ncbi:MAG TPA: hypothetical protein DCY13_23790 [Verrucomicrobiales bacterium]|nr:hypothetical protein [Verrucomicrobiales bacterium]
MNPTASKTSVTALIRQRPLIFSIVAVVVVTLAGLLLFSGGDKDSATAYYEVKRSNFLISIVEGGNLEAVKEVSIRSQVEGTARVISIVPEGTYVKEGDLLVELDSGTAQDQLNQQEIATEKARLGFIQAQEQLAIQRSQTNSDITAAMINLELAKIDLEKFKEGELAQQRRQLELDVDTFNEQMTVDFERYHFSTNLLAAGFETKAKADADRLTWLRTKKNLQQATNALWMFETFDQNKLLTEYQSKVDEAQQEMARVVAQSRAKIAQFEADVLTQERTLKLNQDKLERDRKNLEGCRILAPSSGLVVYPISESRFSQESMIEEGATVRYRQEMIKLPDTSTMKLTIKVHESHVGKIRAGQTAYVVLDPMPDQRFVGTVSRVALLPNNSDRWSNPNLKVYNTEILIADTLPDTVKPGVSAKAEVIITNLLDVLTVPVQAVTTLKGQSVVYLAGSTPKAVPVEVGMFNTKFIQVISGIEEGDRVLLSPPLDSQANDLEGNILQEGDTIPTNTVVVAGIEPAATTSGSGNGGERNGTQQAGGSDAQAERRAGGTGGSGREEMIKQFDKDGDGELNDEERAAMRSQLQSQFSGDRSGGGFNREAMMKQFDKNGDGTIDDEERAAMRSRFSQGRGGAGAGGSPGGQSGGAQRTGGDQQ